MIVIGGSFYKDNKNICPLIIKSAADIPYQPKNTPSTFEYGIMKQRMIPGDTIYRYETQFGKFIILICRDFDDLAHYFRGTDIDILIANVGLHGGTSIFGQINKDHFKELVDEKCKSAEDSTYKLCEVKEKQEEVIIADFNLKHKNIQKPAPSNPDEEIRSVENIRKTPI
jgi:predicted amidohydrolase